MNDTTRIIAYSVIMVGMMILIKGADLESLAMTSFGGVVALIGALVLTYAKLLVKK